MDWKQIWWDPVSGVLSRVLNFLPYLLGALIVLVVGWIVAKLIQKLATRIFKWLRFDTISDKSGLTNLLKNAGIKYTLSQLIGILLYWFVMLLVFISALNVLNLNITAQLLDKIIFYIPNVIAAIFVFVVGLYLASFLAGLVKTAMGGIGVQEANFLGNLTRAIIILFALVISLQQLKIQAGILSFALNIIIASLGLAFGLAFGLGGKDIASRMLEEWRNRLRKKEEITQ
ncbi:MAG: hypothetical protein B6D53_01870 [Candidatus Omnitrophica bacterium 4484_49]|nr:hypothetical protein [Candidatus Omnitrophota bacterium]OQX83696.1 MAG: hypothetical protein B6D53_01870 [Candidatus Omnitrophica bacterium 4484_49]